MLFSSPPFLVFFAIYLLCHLLTPRPYRLLLIVAGSTVFYSYWNPAYVWVPHALMLMAYAGALLMERAANETARRRRLVAVIVALLAPLAVFKYTNFIHQSLGSPFGAGRPLLDVPLPLGISFITFSLIAYVVDAFKGEFPVQRSFQRLAAYVAFFPHLIAGPILRPHELIPQLGRARRASAGRLTVGTMVFSVGLVKKLVFADPLSVVVDAVYGGSGHSAAEYLLAIYGFSLQIYCDFSGYTDMAIGLAMVLGVHLPNNFARPYGAASIGDFWRRWHITLSRWLRDYLYIPLGGNRRGLAPQIRNVFVTMSLGGLWHGANWTFVIWGIIHGAGIAASYLGRRFKTARVPLVVPRWVLTVATFHFVTVAWVFFRAPDVATVARVLTGPFVAGAGDLAAFASASAFPLALLAVFLATHRFDDHRRFRLFVRQAPAVVVWPAIALMWVLAIAISAGSSAKFIYFDF